ISFSFLCRTPQFNIAVAIFLRDSISDTLIFQAPMPVFLGFSNFYKLTFLKDFHKLNLAKPIIGDGNDPVQRIFPWVNINTSIPDEVSRNIAPAERCTVR